MNVARRRSRLLVVALLLFITGSALAWDNHYRRTVGADSPLPPAARFMVIENGGRRVSRPASPVRRRETVEPPAPRPRPPRPQPAPAPRFREEKVRAGDSLYRVAERTLGRGSRWMEIARLNDLDPPYVIREGETLRIPGR